MRRLGERAGGWKVGYSPEGGIFCAPIYASKVHASPASLPASGLSRDRDRVRDRLPRQPGVRPARAALWARRRAVGVLAAPDDRGRRFALPGFPLARPAAGARRQFLERRAGVRRRRLELAGDGPGAPADRRHRRRQNTRGMHRAARRRPDHAAGRAGQFCREPARRCSPPAPSSRPARIPGWCSPSPVPIFAPITARSGSSRCRFRDSSTRRIGR